MRTIKILEWFSTIDKKYRLGNTFRVYPSVIYFEIFGRFTVIYYKLR